MAELPVCALTCLGHAAAAANCSFSDIACSCGNEVFVNYATPCITDTCTIREALFTQNQTAVLCHVHPHVDKSYVPLAFTLFAITFIVFLLRVAARVVSQAKFWYDDYFNFAAFVTVTVYAFIDTALLSKQGFGVDIWAVPQDNIGYILILFLVNSCLYCVVRALIRVSILLFYLRIFCTPTARILITWTIAVIVVFAFTNVISIIFECAPVNYLWLHWDGTHKGHCINFRAFVWSTTVISIALDFWAILLACYFVSRLQLPFKKKIMVSSMFTVGLLVIAVSIARLRYINQFTVTQNPTIDWVPITIWSVLESYTGVICACLPSLPALLKSLPTMKRPSFTRKFNSSSCLAGQRMQAVEHDPDSRKDVLVYEMRAKYGKATGGGGGEGVVTDNSPRAYDNFILLEPESQ
ncbi:hypothetical protein F4802DRAFT_56462 [Xylaria palmicola]|nr:hypothetical protein F4802DRAFT_56462 [Xylaria palmicola]